MTSTSDTATWTDRASFLPTTRAEIDALGWKQPDVVFVSGDAYVDHPSFAIIRPLQPRSWDAGSSATASKSQCCRSPTGGAPIPGANSVRRASSTR
jgi:hypothetical protein